MFGESMSTISNFVKESNAAREPLSLIDVLSFVAGLVRPNSEKFLLIRYEFRGERNYGPECLRKYQQN